MSAPSPTCPRLSLLVLALAACGDPLVGPSYVGTPELEVHGVVRQANSRIPSAHGALRLSVFWIGAVGGGGGGVEQEARLESGLAEYSMKLFDAPAEGASGFGSLMPDSPLALGVIALYADKNENGRLDLDADLLLGASAQHLVVFAGRAIAAGSPAAALLGPLGAGYHVVEHDRPSLCHFVDAARCAPEGGLVEVARPSTVALTLWELPEQVVVPAPALAGGTVWSLSP